MKNKSKIFTSIAILVFLGFLLFASQVETNDQIISPVISCVTTTFENYGNRTHIGRIEGTIMQFSYGWFSLDSPYVYNEPSGQTIAFWDYGSYGEILFDEPVAEIHFFVSSVLDVLVECFDDCSGNLLATATASANAPPYDTWVPVVVSYGVNLITRVRISGGRAHTAIDDFGYCQVQGDFVPVEIDVKPGNANDIDPINLRSQGLLPVAVFTTNNFDALTLDVTRATLGDPLLSARAGVVKSAIGDVDYDGDLDAVLFFDVKVVDCSAIDSETTQVMLTGVTLDGTVVSGLDEVRIVPPHK